MSIVVTYYNKNGNTNCGNYRDISLLSNTYTILSIILLSRLTPYAEEITGDLLCGFRGNMPNTDHIRCIRQILQTKFE
jgi:hypothetical protein